MVPCELQEKTFLLLLFKVLPCRGKCVSEIEALESVLSDHIGSS